MNLMLILRSTHAISVETSLSLISGLAKYYVYYLYICLQKQMRIRTFIVQTTITFYQVVGAATVYVAIVNLLLGDSDLETTR